MIVLVDSIEVVGALSRCTLLHSVCNFKATQMNVQHSLIQQPMLYEFKLGRNTTEATKNICCARDDGAVDPGTINSWLVGWLVGWVLWLINLCRLFNAKSIFMKIVLFQTIQFSISMQFKCK